MAIEITRPGKYSLQVEAPVMPAAGTVGFGKGYDGLVNYDKIGAVVTNPVTIEPWSPATGTRIVPLDAGVLVHTGLPNPGLNRVVKQYRKVWAKLSIPVIMHLVGTTVSHIERAGNRIDDVEEIAGVELGLNDDISEDDAFALVEAAAKMEKPVLVRLPFYETYKLADAVIDAGADALVVSGAPRGTARDVHSGRLVSGRVFGPLVKPMTLRMVGRLRRRIPEEIPIIGSGGIHTPQDGRDFIEAGAVAVQVDSATWAQPRMLERISRDLAGWIITRETGSLTDEWHPDMGDTEAIQQHNTQRGSAKDKS